MNYVFTLEYNDDILLNTGLSKDEFDLETRFLLAAKLYEMGCLSSGQAVKLCGKKRLDCLLYLSRIGVSVSNLRSILHCFYTIYSISR